METKTINEEMKVAAAHAIANLARERVPDEVASAMGGITYLWKRIYYTIYFRS